MNAYAHTQPVHATDVYQAHRDVLARFPEVDRPDARAALGVLFVADNGVARVQSLTPPSGDFKRIEVTAPTSARFWIRAEPAKRDAKTGRIVGLQEPEWIGWITAAMERHGMRIEAEVHDWQILRGRKGPHWIEHLAVDFCGHAETLDCHAATQALLHGVGRGKAFGCGFLRMEGVNDHL